MSRLYELLPAVHRSKDEELGFPLRELLGVIEEQARLIGADLDQLYDNWFIETCQDWIAPYIGDLVGYRPLEGPGEEGPPGLISALAPRRDIANTIANRRRKGSLALLEQLALDVAAWPARAVEFYRLLSQTQPVRLYGTDAGMNAVRRRRGRLADLRDGDALDRLSGGRTLHAGLSGPFDELSHTVEVSRSSSRRRQGRTNIPNVGVFLWRLRPYSVTDAPANCEERKSATYTFSILGNEIPLMTKPVPEPPVLHIAAEDNVPTFIRRRAFEERTADYYGEGKSLCIWRGDQEDPVPLSAIVPANLSGDGYRPKPGQVAVDPELGRFVFGGRPPDSGVWVTYHHGFSADIGGGEYHRELSTGDAEVYSVGGDGGHRRIMDAVVRWYREREEHPHAIIEICDNGAYQEQIDLDVRPGERLVLRAAQGKRPVLRLLDWYSNRPDALRISGPECPPEDADCCAKPEVVLDGLVITGRSVCVSGWLGRVQIRHCTLVPGWSLDQRCEPAFEEEPSLELVDTTACTQIEHSVLGTIRVNQNEVSTEPLPIFLSDSVLDATATHLDALTAPQDCHAHAVFSAARSTVVGRIRTHQIGLVDNSVLLGEVCVARRMDGCIRFSWVEPGSRTPRRHECQPETTESVGRLRPRFTSLRYGQPGYAQLALDCSEEVRRGADDGSEMGAFHDLFQPQREDNLRARIDEFTPAGCDAGLFFVS
ncbi:hypothetical protein GCM10022247_29260 [Allokutzneria multivorans]|uniref:Uncharacterized protein n=1 Tax=Allokutzneria multivorans TaxID=1142134 RepID=A0ABP7S2H4_9PSEU